MSYGIPVMLTLSVIVYRYIFNNVTIDAYFGGFLFLVLITMLFAAGTKSQSINELFKPRLKIYDEATEWSDDQAKKKDNRIKQVVVNDDKILLSLFISTASFVLFWSGSIFGGLFLPFIVLIIYFFMNI